MNLIYLYPAPKVQKSPAKGDFYSGESINADKLAFEKANHEYNDLYYQILWNQSKGFTLMMIENSSKSTAELIRTAWLEAGSPRIPKEIVF